MALSDNVGLSDGLSDGLSHSQLKRKRKNGTITEPELARLRTLEADAQQRLRKKAQQPDPEPVTPAPTPAPRPEPRPEPVPTPWKVFERKAATQSVTVEEMQKFAVQLDEMWAYRRTVSLSSVPRTAEEFKEQERLGNFDWVNYCRWEYAKAERRRLLLSLLHVKPEESKPQPVADIQVPECDVFNEFELPETYSADAMDDVSGF
jgi:hypothetical protein